MKRCIGIAMFLLLIGEIGFFVWSVGFESHFKNSFSKKALTKLHENLRLGDFQPRVVELYNQFQTDRTRLRKEVLPHVWTVEMPFELGSGDWVLYLEFDDAERLSAAVIRTSDGIFRRPRDAPEDKGRFALATKHSNRN